MGFLSGFSKVGFVENYDLKVQFSCFLRILAHGCEKKNQGKGPMTDLPIMGYLVCVFALFTS